MIECDCKTFAVATPMDFAAHELGNGHHPNCPHFIPYVGAVDLLDKLAEGIKWWADQEDGVPDELWEAYKRAVWITKRRMLSDKQE